MELGSDYVSRSTLVYQTSAIFATRAYLIKALYGLSPNTLSDPGIPLVDTPLGTTPTTPRSPARMGGSGYFELAVLPPPGVARVHPRGGASEWGWGPTSVARTAFALCFSESCALFLLVMCQAYDVMNA
ncbi:hypothetical protein FRC07_004656, partial [Ceratobasidium sp. 392]